MWARKSATCAYPGVGTATHTRSARHVRIVMVASAHTDRLGRIVTPRWEDAAMEITVPQGRPNWRFMRYVRPPGDKQDTPLFPLRPSTRPLRLGFDVETIPQPPVGHLAGFLTRNEIELHLLMPEDQEQPPAAWEQVRDSPILHTVGFTTITEAGRFMDAVEFGITSKSEGEEMFGTARFFAVYQQLDEQDAPEGLPPLGLDERHRAAAYAAAAREFGIDLLVTGMATAGRADVADNDLVVSVSPDEAVPIIGQYLRVTSNPIVTAEQGNLVGGGAWETTESTGSVVNMYDWGTVSGLPYFDAASSFAAHTHGGPELVEALTSVRVRLSRAAKALDHLLAALSNPLDGKRTEDVAEAAAEAFDRELLYLSAVFDIYGRAYLALIDPSIDRKKARGSMDSRAFISNQVRTQYDAAFLEDIDRLRVYAWLCKQLRNHIHEGILAVDPHPGRSYGSSKNVALNLGRIPELAPGAGNDMTQEHYDALGVWHTDTVSFFGSSAMVADLATTGFTLMRTGLEYAEAFTKLIIRNKPVAMLNAEQAAAQQNSDGDASAEQTPTPNSFLGCVQAQPGEVEPPPHEKALLYSALFGWHPEEVSP